MTIGPQQPTLSVAEMMLVWQQAPNSDQPKVVSDATNASSGSGLEQAPCLNFQQIQQEYDRMILKAHGVPINSPTVLDLKAPQPARAIELIKENLQQHPKVELCYSSPLETINPQNNRLIILVADVHRQSELRDEAGRQELGRIDQIREQYLKALLALFQNQDLKLGDCAWEHFRLLASPGENCLGPAADFASNDNLSLSNALKQYLKSRGIDREFYAAEKFSSKLEMLIHQIAVNCLDLKERKEALKLLTQTIAADFIRINQATQIDLTELIKYAHSITNDFIEGVGSLSLKALELKRKQEIPGFSILTHIPNPKLGLNPQVVREFYKTLHGLKTIERDPIIANQLSKFQAGIHTMVTGAKHVAGITEELEKNGIPVVVLKHKDLHEVDDDDFLGRLKSKEKNQEWRSKISRQYQDALNALRWAAA